MAFTYEKVILENCVLIISIHNLFNNSEFSHCRFKKKMLLAY